MLFQSYSFVFGFLPAVVLVSQLLRRPGTDFRLRIYFLVAASIVFYGWLSPTSLPFLATSCTLNLLLGNLFHGRSTARQRNGTILWLGILLNVVLLAALKYSVQLSWLGFPKEGIFPLGASFITFVQIVYLVESANGSLQKLPIAEYLQVTAFFGFVTAGPIVSPAELAKQQTSPDNARPLDSNEMLAGVALFSMGLFKKLVIADSMAPYASSVFDVASTGHAVTAGDAWLGSVLYMLQLYFDFSGYSDMAIAIGFLVGVKLPLNFNSPFKATTAIDYWRRWHMTLTRFITNFLYLPLAVFATRWSNDARVERDLPRFMVSVALPTLVAFVIAGVWHGNGWTFFVYGLYWAVCLTVCQAWGRYSDTRLPIVVGWILTMLTALLSLIIFRSSSLSAARTVLEATVGQGNAAGPNILPTSLVALCLGLVVALVSLPNTQELLWRYALSSDEVVRPISRLSLLSWTASPAGAVFIGVTGLIALLMGGGPTQFLYYKF